MWLQRLVYIIMLARRCTTLRFTKFKFRAAAESMETFVKPLFTSITDNRRHPKKRIIIESYDGKQKAQIFTYFCGNECHERRSTLKERTTRKTFEKITSSNDWSIKDASVEKYESELFGLCSTKTSFQDQKRSRNKCLLVNSLESWLLMMIYDVLHSNDKFVLNAAFIKTLNAEVLLQFQRFISSNLIRNRNLNFQGTSSDDKRPKTDFPRRRSNFINFDLPDLSETRIGSDSSRSVVSFTSLSARRCQLIILSSSG